MSLNYKVAGEGEPLILIHGLFGSLENLGALARGLAERFKVYSIDLPNHGRSPHTQNTSLPEMAESVEQWLDEQGLQTTSIVGHSLGGKVAMELALRKPQRVNKIVVLDIAPVHYTPHHNEVFAGLLSFEPHTLASRKQADELMSRYVKEPAVRSFLLKNLTRNEAGTFIWRMNLAVLHDDYNKILLANTEGKFSGPILFVKGSNSDYLLEKYRPEIQKRFSSAELKVVSGAGHWLHAEKPDLIASITKNYLQ